MRIVLSLGAAALVGLAACQKPPETAAQAEARMEREAAAARSSIVAQARSWEQWTSAGQADSMAGQFLEDAYDLPPNAPPVHGRAAIQAYYAQQASLGQTTVHLSVDDVMANGPLAVARGAYDIAIQPGPSAPPGMTTVADTGKWVGALRQSSGQWQFTSLIWNSNIPLPPPPAPAPSRRR